jgi:hypothetical protein
MQYSRERTCFTAAMYSIFCVCSPCCGLYADKFFYGVAAEFMVSSPLLPGLLGEEEL